jgi:hypothetical protein
VQWDAIILEKLVYLSNINLWQEIAKLDDKNISKIFSPIKLVNF